LKKSDIWKENEKFWESEILSKKIWKTQNKKLKKRKFFLHFVSLGEKEEQICFIKSQQFFPKKYPFHWNHQTKNGQKICEVFFLSLLKIFLIGFFQKFKENFSPNFFSSELI